MKRMLSDFLQVLFLLFVILFVGISHSFDIHGNMIWLGNDYVANAANDREKVMRNKTEGP